MSQSGARPACRRDGDDLILDLHVQPRASRDEFVGLHGDRLKLRITAPPVDGKANAHLCTFIANAFGVARRDVVLEQGQSGRDKRVRVSRPERIPELIATLLLTVP